eukprot:3399714-Alexandrium_andersonii.AAC.1
MAEQAAQFGGEVVCCRGVFETLQKFAKSYKKGSGFADDLRSGALLEDNDCKTATTKLLTSLGAQFADISAVSGAKAFMSSTYLYGYDPAVRWCGVLPNGAAAVRIHVAGALSVQAFHIGSMLEAWHIVAAVNAEPPPPDFHRVTLDDIKSFVSGLTAERLGELMEAGMLVRHAFVDALDVLHIPTGWYLAETVSQGTLIYGARKSFFDPSASAEDLRLMADLFDQSSKPYGKKLAEIISVLGKGEAHQRRCRGGEGQEAS